MATGGKAGLHIEFPNIGNISVASPCSVSWDSMSGSDRVRFCQKCHLNVYNLNEMTLAEGQKLVERSEGRTCIRFFRRRDGSIITKDCPVGHERIRLMCRVVASFIAFVVSYGMVSVGLARRDMLQANRFSWWEAGSDRNSPAIMGGIEALPPPPPPQSLGNISPYRKDLLARLAKHWKGKLSYKAVVLLVTLRQDGRLINAEVFESSGSTLVDKLAIKAVKQTHFAPLPSWYRGDRLTFKVTAGDESKH